MSGSNERRVIRVERPSEPGRVVLRVSSAEASGQRLVAGWQGKDRRPDRIQLSTPRVGRSAS